MSLVVWTTTLGSLTVRLPTAEIPSLLSPSLRLDINIQILSLQNRDMKQSQFAETEHSPSLSLWFVLIKIVPSGFALLRAPIEVVVANWNRGILRRCNAIKLAAALGCKWLVRHLAGGLIRSHHGVGRTGGRQRRPPCGLGLWMVMAAFVNDLRDLSI